LPIQRGPETQVLILRRALRALEPLSKMKT
jgi:hypothetical protein